MNIFFHCLLILTVFRRLSERWRQENVDKILKTARSNDSLQYMHSASSYLFGILGHEGNGNLRKKQCSESPTPKVGGQEDSLSSKDVQTALESNSQVNTDQSDIQSNNDQSNNQEKNDGGEKMRVKWFMAIIIFAHFCFKVFAYGNHHVQTVQYVMLLNLIIVAYRFQLGKSKNDRAEHEGRVRTVFAANCICILYFTCVSTLQRFGICLHNPSEVSCVRDIYNGFLGEAADIANLVSLCCVPCYETRRNPMFLSTAGPVFISYEFHNSPPRLCNSQFLEN